MLAGGGQVLCCRRGEVHPTQLQLRQLGQTLRHTLPTGILQGAGGCREGVMHKLHVG